MTPGPYIPGPAPEPGQQVGHAGDHPPSWGAVLGLVGTAITGGGPRNAPQPAILSLPAACGQGRGPAVMDTATPSGTPASECGAQLPGPCLDHSHLLAARPPCSSELGPGGLSAGDQQRTEGNLWKFQRVADAANHVTSRVLPFLRGVGYKEVVWANPAGLWILLLPQARGTLLVSALLPAPSPTSQCCPDSLRNKQSFPHSPPPPPPLSEFCCW